MSGRGSDHPVMLVLGAAAAVATIVGVVVQLGGVSLPDVGGLGGFGGCTAELSLSRGSGPSGTEVVVTGSGFPDDEKVTLRFHTEALTPARTDADGTFRVTVVVPGTFDPFAPQQFELHATTEPTVCTGSTPFRLT